MFGNFTHTHIFSFLQHFKQTLGKVVTAFRNSGSQSNRSHINNTYKNNKNNNNQPKKYQKQIK